ncbi:hypothetical protein CB1_001735002 [Camelus ferus]|nr:hypothetical protein CB1_001735002 [Camelus ferus]
MKDAQEKEQARESECPRLPIRAVLGRLDDPPEEAAFGPRGFKKESSAVSKIDENLETRRRQFGLTQKQMSPRHLSTRKQGRKTENGRHCALVLRDFSPFETSICRLKNQNLALPDQHCFLVTVTHTQDYDAQVDAVRYSVSSPEDMCLLEGAGEHPGSSDPGKSFSHVPQLQCPLREDPTVTQAAEQ